MSSVCDPIIFLNILVERNIRNLLSKKLIEANLYYLKIAQ